MSVLRRRALATGMGALATGSGLACLMPGLGVSPLSVSAASTSLTNDFATPAASFANRIGLQLLARTVAKSPNENAVIAPGSVVVALAMAAAATSGATRTALAAALAADTNGQMTLDDVVDRLGALDRALKVPTDSAELTTAATLLMDRKLTPDREFLASLEAALEARARVVDFTSPQTAADLNQWVRESTRGLIPTLVPAFDPRTVLAIATAIFFKGRWLEAFDPQLTKDHPFRTAGGGEKTLPMMARSEERILYFRTGSIHAVRLLYRGNAFETVIATTVERGDTSLARWIAGASAGEWATLINRVDFASAAVELRLPRQELATEANLRDAVAASPALAPLMEPSAQFGRLTGLAVGIDQVLHKALVRMDEEGTVAAAATGLMMFRVSGRPKPVDFTVDRPHVFLIRHMPTGAVVFAGYVADPKPLSAPAG